MCDIRIPASIEISRKPLVCVRDSTAGAKVRQQGCIVDGWVESLECAICRFIMQGEARLEIDLDTKGLPNSLPAPPPLHPV